MKFVFLASILNGEDIATAAPSVEVRVFKTKASAVDWLYNRYVEMMEEIYTSPDGRETFEYNLDKNGYFEVTLDAVFTILKEAVRD